MAKIGMHLNGTQTCELCGGAVSAGSWKSADSSRTNRYMRLHLGRCQTASKEDREQFREHGKWPHKRINRR